MSVELIEIEPGRFRVARPVAVPARSPLPCPHVISDIMDPAEQVDGRIYTSKSQFRAVGRALGLTEVGTEKFKPKRRATDDQKVQEARRGAVRTAFEKYAAGHRPRSRRE
jgi:hypothetical protein